MHTDWKTPIVDRLSRYDGVVEVGVGDRHDVAVDLAERGCRVTATDVRDRTVPDSVGFVRDDITDPDPTVYEDADAIYALNCPPELQRSLAAATPDSADCLFSTLGGDPVVVDASPETFPDGTLFEVER